MHARFGLCLRWFALAALGLVATGVAAGEEGAAADADALRERLRACAALGNDRERLACYDRTADSLEAGATVTAAVPEEVFGLSRERPAARPAAREELNEITARIARVQEFGDGAALVELDNGQVWRQQDGGRQLFLRAGDEVKIVRGAFGSFRLVAPGGRFARVKRIR